MELFRGIRRVVHQLDPFFQERKEWDEVKSRLEETGAVESIESAFEILRENGDKTAEVWETTPKHSSYKYSIILYWDSASRPMEEMDGEHPSSRGIRITLEPNSKRTVEVARGGKWFEIPDEYKLALTSREKIDRQLFAALSMAEPVHYLKTEISAKGEYKKLLPAA